MAVLAVSGGMPWRGGGVGGRGASAGRYQGDDQLELSELEPGGVDGAGRRGTPGQGGARPRCVDLRLQDAELMAQRQHLDVLVGVAHRRQRYEGEHAGECQVGRSQ